MTVRRKCLDLDDVLAQCPEGDIKQQEDIQRKIAKLERTEMLLEDEIDIAKRRTRRFFLGVMEEFIF